MSWLLNTRLGQGLILAVVVLLCWWGFASHYEQKGRDACKAEGNTQYIKTEAKGRDVAQQSDKEVEAVEQQAGQTKVETVEVIRTVYRDRIVTKPVAPGSCVHPVDPAVQAELLARWKDANGGAP
jgi:hypothetical protein